MSDITNYNFRIQTSSNSVPTTDTTNTYSITNIGSVEVVNDKIRGQVFNFSGSNGLTITTTTPIVASRTVWVKTLNPTTSGTVFSSNKWAIWFEAGPNKRLGSAINYSSNPALIDTVDRGSYWVFYAVVFDGTNHSIYVNGNNTPIVTQTTTSVVDSSTIGFGQYSSSNNYRYTGLLDDMRQYNYALTPQQINQIYNATIKTNNQSLDNLLVSKPPWGIYLGELFNPLQSTVLTDITANKRDAIITGNIIKETINLSNGNNVYSISGPTSTNIVWSYGSISPKFTICSITKYNGSSRQRILNATNNNFLHGHWGWSQPGRRGVAYYSNWMTSYDSFGNTDDWLVMCGTNSSTNNIKVLADGVKKNINNAGNIVNGQLTINTSNVYAEPSDFSFMCVFVWNQQLNDTELTTVSDYLINYLNTGIHSDAIKRLISLPCFLEGSKILCLKDKTEIYLPIETLNKGDLVKTLLNGYVPIEVIGKKMIKFNPSLELHQKDKLYICSKDNYPELFEDLVLTGAHSILVDEITNEQCNKIIEIFGKIYVTDNKYRLMTCVDERTEEFNHNTDQTVWHLALENENYYGNYGIYANGLLVESVSIRYMVEFSNMDIKVKN